MSIMDKFTLQQETFIEEYQTWARFWEHNTTKAKILMLENNDINKVFNISFRTPITNSKGIPHILEHSVLNGSKKYPTKEPFVDMLKGSLYTYLNASTWPDSTRYPVASQNNKDFYNLVDVYLDSVLNPLLDQKTFQQEGWHYELNNPQDPLSIKGVVYNEMKGSYSDTDNTLFDFIMRALFPDTPYRHDSGGNPDIIPQLTYEEFIDFHKKHYHPSNSYITFYGDDHSATRFEKIEEFLRNYEYQKPEAQVYTQKPLQNIPDTTEYFDPGENSNGGYITKNWLLHNWNTFELEILNELLLGNPDAPLYQKLIDSGLGEDLVPSGFETSLVQPFFAVGLKNVPLEDFAATIKLIDDSLLQIHQDGFKEADIEAALNSTEFYLRELNTGRSPQGLTLINAVLQNWLYDRDSLENIQFETQLIRLKNKLQENPNYLSDRIKELLIENPHHAILKLEPKPKLIQSKNQSTKQNLETIKNSLSQQEVDDLISNSEILAKHQVKPDSPEAIAAIPKLTLQDLQGVPEKINTTITESKTATILSNTIDTNGITYIKLCFNIDHLKPEQYLLLPFLERGLHEFDTQNQSSAKISNELNIHTGNFSTNILNTLTTTGEFKSYFIISGKALPHKIPKLLNILTELLSELKINNHAKLTQFIKDETLAYQNSFASNGNSMALSHLHSQLHIPGLLNDKVGGVERYNYLKNLSKNNTKEDLNTLSTQLDQLKNTTFGSHKLLVNITTSNTNIARNTKDIQEFISKLPDTKRSAYEHALPQQKDNLAFIAPTKINYNCLAFTIDYAGENNILPLIKYLNLDYLWNKVRVQGGAYNCGASYSSLTKTFSISSFRDPRTTKTYDDYMEVPTYLKQKLSSEQLLQSITGAIGSFDSHQLPNQKGNTALQRYIVGRSYQDIKEMREAILNTKNTHLESLSVALADIDQALRATVTSADNSTEYGFSTISV